MNLKTLIAKHAAAVAASKAMPSDTEDSEFDRVVGREIAAMRKLVSYRTRTPEEFFEKLPIILRDIESCYPRGSQEGTAKIIRSIFADLKAATASRRAPRIAA